MHYTAAVLHSNRVHGQDAYVVRELGPGSSLDAVMDGLSNSNGGHAARLVAARLGDVGISHHDDVVALLEKANAELFGTEHGWLRFFYHLGFFNRAAWFGRQYEHMALTTVTAALRVGTGLYIVNVGDSPAYLVRGRAIITLTQHDVISFEKVEAAVGLRSYLEPHFKYERIETDDRLVFVTDGVSDNLTSEEIRDAVSSAFMPGMAVSNLEGLLAERQAKDVGLRDGRFKVDDATAIVRFL